MNTSTRLQRGVSLIEALVALGVMAFGMLGIAGMQSTLRQNSDASRHRSESMRIAQEAIERARSYSVAGFAAAPKFGFDDLDDVPDQAVAGYTTNVDYTRRIFVNEVPLATLTAAAAPSVPGLVDVPILKTVRVEVLWTDRTTVEQTTRLTSVLHRSPPELAGSLVVPGTGTAVELPGGRHFSIPPRAVDQGDGTSALRPPTAPSDVRWIFSNSTGFVTQVCNSSGCTAVTARSLHGLILFATDPVAPTGVQSENPPSNAFAVTSSIVQNNPPIGSPPTGVPAPSCFTDPIPVAPSTTRSLEYFCLIHVLPVLPQWSGRAQLGGFPVASSASDGSTGVFRVCRYTSVRSNSPVGTGTPPLTNAEHPLNYLNLGQSLINQNFLLIRAGVGTGAFDCPEDDPSTPFVNGRTWHHQPSS